MDNNELKSLIAKDIKRLEKEWHEEADKERGAYDFPSYARTIAIAAEINTLMRVMSLLS